ncbi:MAG: hypothetical protein IT193_11615 [Propionibacteriaceae bacterium]|nr:hypothetical protein [Propionibacteriaceae bacterium]
MSPAHRVIDPGNLTCARCQRPLRLATPGRPSPARGKVLTVIRRWPDGMLCSGCYALACETYGACDGCTVQRLLPGRGPDGQRWCTDCAGGIGNFTCTRCGREGWMQERGVCGRCVMADRLATICDDGTGRIFPNLQPLADRLLAMPRPRTGILWLDKPHVPPILQAIATGVVPLTHDGIATLTPVASANYIRQLLVAVGTLPGYDHQLDRFERWLPGWLATITDPDQRATLTRYARWRILRHLRRTGEHGLTYYRESMARHQLRTAAAFLTFLAGHQRTLECCTQGLLDQWFAAAKPADKTAVRAFIKWAIQARLTRSLRLPPRPRTHGTFISHQQRLELLDRLLNDPGLPAADRLIGTLILLYAQPLQRILHLRTDHILAGTDETTITLNKTPIPVPPAVENLISGYLNHRGSHLPATDPDNPWLFPGRHPGHALQPNAVRDRLRALGIPNSKGRARALRELLLQAPPAVIAPLLGYKAGAAEQIAAQAGNTWKNYAATRHQDAPA